MTTALANGLSGHPQGLFDRQDELNMSKMLSSEETVDDGGEPADITPFQKMLSATTGSLLTGLTSTTLHT